MLLALNANIYSTANLIPNVKLHLFRNNNTYSRAFISIHPTSRDLCRPDVKGCTIITKTEQNCEIANSHQD